jgi:hypothetical protein
MMTVYLIVFTILGGLLALFAVSGWTSYNEGKLPAIQTMFTWFLAGITSSGLASYAWIFGAGGDPGKMIEAVKNSLEVNEIVNSITAPVAEPEPVAPAKPAAMTVGMPNF